MVMVGPSVPSVCLHVTQNRAVADSPEGRAAIPRDIDRLEKRADRNPLKFSKERCRVLLMGRNNPRTCWGLPSWGAALKKRTWGYRWTPA